MKPTNSKLQHRNDNVHLDHLNDLQPQSRRSFLASSIALVASVTFGTATVYAAPDNTTSQPLTAIGLGNMTTENTTHSATITSRDNNSSLNSDQSSSADSISTAETAITTSKTTPTTTKPKTSTSNPSVTPAKKSDGQGTAKTKTAKTTTDKTKVDKTTTDKTSTQTTATKITGIKTTDNNTTATKTADQTSVKTNVSTTANTKTVAASSASTTSTKNISEPSTWSLESLNNADWKNGDATEGRAPVFAKLQVLLNRHHTSPGPIDGAISSKTTLKDGKNNTVKALSAFQTINSLPVTGVLDDATWQSLNASGSEPVFVEYTLTEDDLKGPYAPTPSDYADQAKMKGLYYNRVTEMLGEKFHMDEGFLKQLNPKATFKKSGETIIVANPHNDLPEDIHLIIAHKAAKQLYLFNSQNKMIASFPATIGSSDTPSPTGTYTVKNIAPNPWYGYNPKNFVQGKNNKPLQLPPGPNNPVGNMWIGLSKPSFGIHGTPNPSTISKTASHGCIRLTNWDANDLSKHIKTGITVKFLEGNETEATNN